MQWLCVFAWSPHLYLVINQRIWIYISVISNMFIRWICWIFICPFLVNGWSTTWNIIIKTRRLFTMTIIWIKGRCQYIFPICFTHIIVYWWTIWTVTLYKNIIHGHISLLIIMVFLRKIFLWLLIVIIY